METFGSWLRSFRRQRRLSLGQLSLKSGVNKSTLSRWESETFLPRMAELDSVFDALGATFKERAFALEHLDVPRAIYRAKLAPVDAARLTVGDALYGLRGRAGLAQAEVARRSGISRSLYSKWERGVSIPGDAQLHFVCHALGASAGEAVALAALTEDVAAASLDRDTLLSQSMETLIWEVDPENFRLLSLATLTALGRLFRQGRADIADLAFIVMRMGSGKHLQEGDFGLARRYHQRAKDLALRSSQPLHRNMIIAFEGALGPLRSASPTRRRIDDWLDLTAYFPDNVTQAYIYASLAREVVYVAPQEALKLGEQYCRLSESNELEHPCRLRDFGNLLRFCGQAEDSVEFLAGLKPQDRFREGLIQIDIGLSFIELGHVSEALGQLERGKRILADFPYDLSARHQAYLESKIYPLDETHESR